MARELWIGVDADGEAFLYDIEPEWEGSQFNYYDDARTAWFLATPDAPFDLPPGHKAKLVLDEASVTKGGE